VKSLSAARHLAGGLFEALSELGSIRMFPPRDMRASAHRLAGALTSVGRAHDLVVMARGDIPRGRALIVANHASYLDPLAILQVCPAIPLAKREVAQWPIVGSIAEQLGVVFVDRDDPQSRVRALRRVHDLLATGVPVLNFAEGTTTRGERVAPFHRGTFGVAARLGVPVVPVALRYRDPELAWTGGATFLPHYLETCGRKRVVVDLAFGAPLLVRDGEPAERIAARTRFAVENLLRTMPGGPDARVRTDVSPSRLDAVLPTARVA